MADDFKVGDKIDYAQFSKELMPEIKAALESIMKKSLVIGVNVLLTPNGEFPDDLKLFSMEGTVIEIDDKGKPLNVDVAIVSAKYVKADKADKAT